MPDRKENQKRNKEDSSAVQGVVDNLPKFVDDHKKQPS